MIQRLSSEYAAELKRIRLESLRANPDSFVSTFAYERNFGLNHYVQKLQYYPAPFGTYGHIIEDSLVAYMQLANDHLPKSAHIAYLYELYVSPDHRHTGLASSLLKEMTSICKANSAIELIRLRVNDTNLTAIKLYKNHGYSIIATLPHSIKSEAGYESELILEKNLSN